MRKDWLFQQLLTWNVGTGHYWGQRIGESSACMLQALPVAVFSILYFASSHTSLSLPTKHLLSVPFIYPFIL
jgi:hypothetical protein